MKNKFIRTTALALSVCLLTGCAKPAAYTERDTPPKEANEGVDYQFVFTRENFPKTDGSTSTIPFCQAVAAALLGQSRDKAGELIEFSKTGEAYRGLMKGDSDILFAAEPSEATLEVKESLGFEWEMEPFATDAIVFTVSESNPVDSLTIEQVQKIYSGEITNWSQVGGEDTEIMAFQRSEDAGSQAAMEKCVMGDIPMMEAPMEYVSQDATGLVSTVSNFEDSPAAIGYTFYYYAENMRMADGLKLLKIDGIEPNVATIKSGEYPVLSSYYVVIPSNLPKSHPARMLFDWVLSKEGRELAISEGYVQANTEEKESLSVYTDHSNLSPYSEKPIYSFFIPLSEDGFLKPREDYGELLEYTGEIQIENSQYLYGLVTADGRLVTEPVYSWIHFEGSFMMLAAKEQAPVNGDIVYRYFVAASDGSWIRELKLYHGEFIFNHDLFVIKQEDGSLITLNGDGETVSEFSADIFKNHFGSDFQWYKVTESVEKGVLCFSLQEDEGHDTLYLDVTTGEVLADPAQGHQWTGVKVNSSQHEEAAAKLTGEIREDYFCYYSNETGETIFSYPIKTNND